MMDFDEKKISERIRDLRLEKGLTLDRIASITGLTKGYLSRIENSDKSPPFSTLAKIASALNTDIISFLFEEAEAASDINLDLVRAEERKTIGRRFAPEAYMYESLAYRLRGKNMEPMLVTMDENAPIVEFHHEGEEFIYILEGKLEFYYEGRTYILEPGDSIYFNSGMLHSGRSLGEEPVKFLCIIYSYKRI
jgi:quercetin dioxygenase-like cupin family protein/DNA-binding Xre family transcriptional regulator